MYIHKYRFYKDYYNKLKAGSHPQPDAHRLIGIGDDDTTLDIPDDCTNIDDLSSHIERETGNLKGNIDIFDPSIETPLPYFYPIKPDTDYYYLITNRNRREIGEKLNRDNVLLKSILTQAKKQGYLDIETLNKQSKNDRIDKVYMRLEKDSQLVQSTTPFTIVMCRSVWPNPDLGFDHWGEPKVYQIMTQDWIIDTYFEKGYTDESGDIFYDTREYDSSPFPKIQLDPNITLVPFDEIDAVKLNCRIDQQWSLTKDKLIPI